MPGPVDLSKWQPTGRAVEHVMTDLLEHTIGCPYCGEAITIFADPSVPQQEYVEDCQVCCRAWEVYVEFKSDEPEIRVVSDSD